MKGFHCVGEAPGRKRAWGPEGRRGGGSGVSYPDVLLVNALRSWLISLRV